MEFLGEVPTEVADQASKVMCDILPIGRMISSVKRGPKGHLCVWNANVLVDGKKVWYGDLDLTTDALALQMCANQIGRPLYVLPEMAARFDKESNPDMSRVVQVIYPIGR